MSRGHCQTGNQTGRRTLERCKSKGIVENVEIIDVDKGESDVVIIDVPESSGPESRCFRAKTRDSCPSVISIDDEDGGIDETPRNACYAATSSTFRPLSSNSPLYVELDSDECLMSVRKGTFLSKLTAKVKMHPSCGSPRNRYGLDPALDSGASESDGSEICTSEGGSSESDSSDCEIMEDVSGEIREWWERAALRKKMPQRSRFVSEDQASASGSSADPGYRSEEATQNMVNINSINNSDKAHSRHFEVPAECGPSSSSNGKNCSSRMADADEFTKDFLQVSKGNNSVANSDPCTGISQDGPGFQKEERISDECSCRAQSSDETYFNHKRNCSQDLEMEGSIHDRDAGFSFLNVDEEVPVETCCCGAEIWFGTIFQTQSTHHSFITHELAAQVKEKSFIDHTVPFSDQPRDKLQNDIGNQSFCHSKESIIEPICNPDTESGATESCPLYMEPDLSHIQNSLIWEREKHKESDEYKHAEAEEWASRQQELQIQAEEAQRLRKKRKAENLRLMEMEKRQKQRLEEIRESQKKDEEIIHLKEQLRAEVRKELDQMEGRYRDMASLLRGLGIHVDGGSFPLSREVNAAYKQALLKFHPDRASTSDIRRQVEAEETFKLISRLKEKLLPVA